MVDEQQGPSFQDVVYSHLPRTVRCQVTVNCTEALTLGDRDLYLHLHNLFLQLKLTRHVFPQKSAYFTINAKTLKKCRTLIQEETLESDHLENVIFPVGIKHPTPLLLMGEVCWVLTLD